MNTIKIFAVFGLVLLIGVGNLLAMSLKRQDSSYKLDLFGKFDVDKDQKLSLDEIMAGVKEHLGITDEHQILRAFQSEDRNQNGFIEFNEFKK